MKKRFADGGNAVISGTPQSAFGAPPMPQGLASLPAAGMGSPMAVQAPPVGMQQQQSPYPQPASTFAPKAFKKGGAVKSFKKGGSVKSSASRRGDGIAQRGKTRGRNV